MRLDLRLWCAAVLLPALAACGGSGAPPTEERIQEAKRAQEQMDAVERNLLAPRNGEEERLGDTETDSENPLPGGESD